VTDLYRIDGQKLSFHPKRVAQWLEGKDDWEKAKDLFPIYIEVSPVGHCNHACGFCGVDYVMDANKKNRVSPMIDQENFGERIHEMGRLGVKSVMFAGEGEPLLHKHINNMTSFAIASGIDVSFTTNGTLLHNLDLHAVSWVKVSINAGTEATYMQVHKARAGDWDKVWRNVKEAVAHRNGCDIGVQMVLLPENEHEVDAFRAKAEAAGVDYAVVKSFSQHKFSLNRQYEKFIPIAPVGSGKLIVRRESMETKEIPYDKCQATPFMWGYWSANGDFYSCSAYLLDARFNLGNLNTQTFREIWHSDQRKENWRYVMNDLNIHQCRINCRMNSSNVYLDELVKGAHNSNFI